MTRFEIEEAWIFEPRDGGPRQSVRPFEFVRDLFLKRRKIKERSERAGRYDIREKAIKLALNSIYGKLAQSVGGDGEAPAVANPYYAAATTAYCRRRLIEAALIDPHAIVFFATDGIVSTRELHGLARVRRKGDVVPPEKPDRLLIYVDQWEELYAMAPPPEDKERLDQHSADVEKFIELLVAAASGRRIAGERRHDGAGRLLQSADPQSAASPRSCRSSRSTSRR